MPRAIALAPAKINIGLEVIAKQADGMHKIVSILQTISLFDRMYWVNSNAQFLYESPGNIPHESDLTRLALNHAADQTRWSGSLALRKSIPVAAGLGGGSSDAALALRIALPGVSKNELVRTASGLGSDVPFFLEGGTALGTGTGTTLEQLPDQRAWCVVVTPPVVIAAKTRTLYGSLTCEDFTDGSQTGDIAWNLSRHILPVTAPPNAFSRHVMEYPEIAAAHEGLMTAGAPWVGVSGAGPSLYTLVGRFREACMVAQRVPRGAGETIIACTLPHRHGDTAAENMAARLRTGKVAR